jgi:hypothetical protein
MPNLAANIAGFGFYWKEVDVLSFGGFIIVTMSENLIKREIICLDTVGR